MTIDEMFRRFGIEIDTIEFDAYVGEYTLYALEPGGMVTAWAGDYYDTETRMADGEQDRPRHGKRDGPGQERTINCDVVGTYISTDGANIEAQDVH